MNSILATQQSQALKKLGAFDLNNKVDFKTADKNQTVATAKTVKLTAKYKQAAQNAKEKIENTYNSSIDSKDSKQAKKLAFLKKIGLSRISLSKILKNQIKHVAAHICSFERRLIEHAIKNECTQVICGHIHNPAQKTYDWGNYYNCGDWIENNTAIIEHLDGRFEITKFQEKDK